MLSPSSKIFVLPLSVADSLINGTGWIYLVRKQIQLVSFVFHVSDPLGHFWSSGASKDMSLAGHDEHFNVQSLLSTKWLGHTSALPSSSYCHQCILTKLDGSTSCLRYSIFCNLVM